VGKTSQTTIHPLFSSSEPAHVQAPITISCSMSPQQTMLQERLPMQDGLNAQNFTLHATEAQTWAENTGPYLDNMCCQR
jgi:hypothetical protein